MKAAILATALLVAGGGAFNGIASADPAAPGPSPGPAPGPATSVDQAPGPAPGPATPDVAALGPGPAPGPAPVPPPAAGADPAVPAPGAPVAAMDHDGIFIVGTDIQPGTYTTAGPVEDGSCYWKRMADLHGGDIIDNAFTKRSQTVQIAATDKAFKTNGCQPWQKTDAAPTELPPQTGPLPALAAKAQLRAWLDSMNTNAGQYDGSQVPLP